MLEANLKAMSVHLFQRDALKVPHENGINHQEITPQAVSYHCTVIDANGTNLQDPAGQPGWRHSTSSDDNVRMKIDYSCSIGEDYLQKIQVVSVITLIVSDKCLFKMFFMDLFIYC